MTNNNPAALLRALVAVSGLPVAHFATQRMGRPPRTVYSWINGRNPVPEVVMEWCQLQPEYPKALELLSSVPDSPAESHSAPRSA